MMQINKHTNIYLSCFGLRPNNITLMQYQLNLLNSDRIINSKCLEVVKTCDKVENLFLFFQSQRKRRRGHLETEDRHPSSPHARTRCTSR